MASAASPSPSLFTNALGEVLSYWVQRPRAERFPLALLSAHPLLREGVEQHVGSAFTAELERSGRPEQWAEYHGAGLPGVAIYRRFPRTPVKSAAYAPDRPQQPWQPTPPPSTSMTVVVKSISSSSSRATPPSWHWSWWWILRRPVASLQLIFCMPAKEFVVEDVQDLLPPSLTHATTALHVTSLGFANIRFASPRVINNLLMTYGSGLSSALFSHCSVAYDPSLRTSIALQPPTTAVRHLTCYHCGGHEFWSMIQCCFFASQDLPTRPDPLAVLSLTDCIFTGAELKSVLLSVAHHNSCNGTGEGSSLAEVNLSYLKVRSPNGFGAVRDGVVEMPLEERTALAALFSRITGLLLTSVKEDGIRPLVAIVRSALLSHERMRLVDCRWSSTISDAVLMEWARRGVKSEYVRIGGTAITRVVAEEFAEAVSP